MSELTREDREIVEHLKRCIIAAGIFKGLEYNNIASTQDAINKIANACNVDLSVPADRMKFQEGCRKAALAYLESEGIIEQVKDGDNVRYQIKPEREQEYKDAIFLAKRQKENAENLSHLIKALKSVKDLVDGVRKVCQVVAPGIAQMGAMFGCIAATAQHVTDICDKWDESDEKSKELFKTAAKEVSEIIYKTPERDENPKRLWEIIKKIRDKEIFKMRCEPVTNIHDAEFTKRSRVKAEKRFKSGLSTHEKEHPERRKSLFDRAEDLSMITKGDNKIVDLFGAFPDIDAMIRPDGPPITKEDISPEAAKKTNLELKDINPILDAALKLPGMIKGQIFDINPQVGFLQKLSKLRKHKDKMPPKLYEFFHGYLASRESTHYEKIKDKKFMREGELEKATVNIAHFNSINESSRSRGANYAYEYSGLTLYRCGKSELLVESMGYFQMNTLDKIWAISYMKAGMMESLHGIRYMGRQADANGIRYESSTLHSKAEAVFRHYIDGKGVHELDEVCNKMSEEFISEHKDMIDRISVRRREEGMPELQEITYITEVFNNAKDQGKKDHLDIELVNWKDIDTLDASDLYEKKQKDGYFIKDPEHESVALFLFAEERGIVALVDECETITDMKLTADSYHRYTENRDVMKMEYAEPRDAMITDKAVKCIAKDIGDPKRQKTIRGEWREFVKTSIKNDFKPMQYSDGEVTRLALIDRPTGITMLINEHEPDPGYQSVSVQQFARDIAREEYKRVLMENNISLEQAESIVLPNNHPNKIQLKILNTIDKSNELMQFTKASMQFAEMTNAENVLNPKTRETMIKELTESVSGKNISKLKTLQIEYQHRYSEYQELVQVDPVLARCKITVPDCERDGDVIYATTSSGKTFSMDTQTMEVSGFDKNDKEIKDLYREIFSAIMVDEDVLENLKDTEKNEMER